MCAAYSLTQSGPTLPNLVDDHTWPARLLCGIFQARILEQFAISSSRGSSRPKDQTCVRLLHPLHCRQILHY